MKDYVRGSFEMRDIDDGFELVGFVLLESAELMIEDRSAQEWGSNNPCIYFIDLTRSLSSHKSENLELSKSLISAISSFSLSVVISYH